MPKIWKYLINSYIKVVFLSTFGFISILLLIRMKEIARFIALSSNAFSVIKYILFQIPYILPLALPISCLIAAYFLFMQMSQNHELTALRSNGFSLYSIISPVIILSLGLGLINFYISSEWTTRCLAKSKEILYKESSKNPILLLKRQELSKLSKCYIEMKSDEKDTYANDLLFISYNHSNHRLHLFTCKNLVVDKESLLGKNISTISYFDQNNQTVFDPLIIENQEQMSARADLLSQMIKTQKTTSNPYHLPWAQLFEKRRIQKEASLSSRFESIYAEIFRRMALGVSVFTFTFMGIVFAINPGRSQNNQKLIILSSMVLLLLISFVFGKALKYYAISAFFTYFVPQALCLYISYYYFKRLHEGRI